MLLSVILDPDADTIDDTAVFGSVSQAWDKFCEQYSLPKDADVARSSFVEFAEAAKYKAVCIEIPIETIGATLKETITRDFISVKDALRDLVKLAETNFPNADDEARKTIRRARHALEVMGIKSDD